jgi:hypothetical protein
MWCRCGIITRPKRYICCNKMKHKHLHLSEDVSEALEIAAKQGRRTQSSLADELLREALAYRPRGQVSTIPASE